MKLLFSIEGLRRKLLGDPDDEPMAGAASREEQLEQALRELMAAYERRVRTDCTPLQLELRPWRCCEYLAAEDLLRRST